MQTRMNKQTKYLEHKKKQENENVTHLCLNYPQLACFLLFCYSLLLGGYSKCYFSGSEPLIDSLAIFVLKIIKMSLAEALRGMLALMPAN